MNRSILLLAASLLFTACKKEKETAGPGGQREKPSGGSGNAPKTLIYRMSDSIFTVSGYSNGPDGYKSYRNDSLYPVSYTHTVTVDTLTVVKQLIYQGVSFEREGGAGSGFKKISPRPLQGEVIWITLKSDSILVSCAYDSWQTWKKSYTLHGKLK